MALAALAAAGMPRSRAAVAAARREAGSERLEAAAIRLAVESDPEASARRIQRELRRRARQELRGAPSAEEQRRRFNRFFFAEEAFRPLSDEGSPEGLFLHRVLERRGGTCVGLAQVYLILAERLELPVVAAATPAHVLVRWVQENGRVNVELLEEGAEHPDAAYRARHGIREADLSHPVFLRDLGAPEVVARIYNNRGVIRSAAGLLEQAASDYARAIDLDPLFPAPLYNRGLLDRLNSGRPQEALADLEAALALHPGDTWALNNRGLALLMLGRRWEAERDFRAALVIEPSLAAAKKNLSIVTSAPRDRAPAPRGTGPRPQTGPARKTPGEPSAPRP